MNDLDILCGPLIPLKYTPVKMMGRLRGPTRAGARLHTYCVRSGVPWRLGNGKDNTQSPSKPAR